MNNEPFTGDTSTSDSGFDYERFAMEEEEAERRRQNGEAGGRKPEFRKVKTSKAPKAPTDIKENDKSKDGSDAYEWLQCLVTALLFCVIIFSFFVRIIGIVGSSMVPTLHDRDSVAISNLFYEPKQGDIVVLRKDTFKPDPIIKRVIAVEGQTVDIDFENGIVYVDGEALDEPYIAEPTTNQINFDGMITVPENSVFVMGDNRNKSSDSRDSSIGCVDERYIMGRVLIRILPLSSFGIVD